MGDMIDMPPAPGSLLPQGEQLDLIKPEDLHLGHELLTIEQDEQSGRYTGERIAKHRERYQAIVDALGNAEGVRSICRRLNVSPSSVMRIRENERVAIETQKKKTAANLRLFAEMGSERMLESLEAFKLDGLPLAVAIAVDKVRDLEGEPSQRIRVDVHDHRHVDINEAIDLLPSEVTVATGSEAPENRQKGVAPAGLLEGAQDPAGGDNQSPERRA